MNDSIAVVKLLDIQKEVDIPGEHTWGMAVTDDENVRGCRELFGDDPADLRPGDS